MESLLPDGAAFDARVEASEAEERLLLGRVQALVEAASVFAASFSPLPGSGFAPRGALAALADGLAVLAGEAVGPGEGAAAEAGGGDTSPEARLAAAFDLQIGRAHV